MNGGNGRSKERSIGSWSHGLRKEKDEANRIVVPSGERGWGGRGPGVSNVLARIEGMKQRRNSLLFSLFCETRQLKATDTKKLDVVLDQMLKIY